MKKECGYCHKPVEEGAEVKSTLLYLNGSQLAQKEKEYCSKQCAEAERMLASSKRHLGDELHDQFSITLADMKPEYVA
ncbi:hypothetical protein JTX50_001465 [Escherichia coli]|nr:hypothetical protein [Escherichia coli]